MHTISRRFLLILLLSLLSAPMLAGCRSKTVAPYAGKGGAQQGGVMNGAGGYGGFPEGRITEEMRPGAAGDPWTTTGGYGGHGAGGASSGYGPADESLDATGGAGGRSGSLYAGGGQGSGRSSSGLTSIFFKFDSSAIRDDQQISALERNAAFLGGNPGRRVLIEGNTDPRGTQEYNLALGERRAAAAMGYLASLGVAESRIRTISYGEERPLAPGDSESDYARNRRADFVLE